MDELARNANEVQDKEVSDYTASEIRDIILQKGLEGYYGRVILYFKAGKIGVIEYQTTEIKADEVKPAAQGSGCGDLATR